MNDILFHFYSRLALSLWLIRESLIRPFLMLNFRLFLFISIYKIENFHNKTQKWKDCSNLNLSIPGPSKYEN